MLACKHDKWKTLSVWELFTDQVGRIFAGLNWPVLVRQAYDSNKKEVVLELLNLTRDLFNNSAYAQTWTLLHRDMNKWVRQKAFHFFIGVSLWPLKSSMSYGEKRMRYECFFSYTIFYFFSHDSSLFVNSVIPSRLVFFPKRFFSVGREKETACSLFSKLWRKKYVHSKFIQRNIISISTNKYDYDC